MWNFLISILLRINIEWVFLFNMVVGICLCLLVWKLWIFLVIVNKEYKDEEKIIYCKKKRNKIII